MITTRPAATRAAGHPRHDQTVLEVALPVPPAPVDHRMQVLVLAGLSAGAAAIHAAVVPEHLREYWLFAAFFAAVAVFQGGWALAVARRSSARLYLIGAAASAALVVLWVVSRTAGLPLGPQPWHPEPAAVLDVLASLLEMMIIVVAANARRRLPRTEPT